VTDFAAIAASVRATSPRCGAVRVVAVDGGAASGKTTFAETLMGQLDASQVLHCDDLLDGWTDQFTFRPRLVSLLARLARGEIGRYRRYDWHLGGFGTEEVEIQPHGDLVVEGVGAISACATYASFRIYLDIPRAERERRWIERDGSPLQPEWKRWLDAEDNFFDRHPPVADVTIDWPVA
jgi:uridine kinase